jgi:hypothetical protein
MGRNTPQYKARLALLPFRSKQPMVGLCLSRLTGIQIKLPSASNTMKQIVSVFDEEKSGELARPKLK